MPLLAFPLALLALSSLPALAAIYWLRNRYRRQVVSSLMLWVDQRSPKEGGTRVQRLQTPLLLLLELLVLLLLALGATGPRMMLDVPPPLVVVLDDSFSMQARDGEPSRSARDRAFEDVRALLNGEKRAQVRLVLAGTEPALLAEASGNPAQLVHALRQWRCRASSSDLVRAVAMARELAGPRARLLVVSDRASPADLEGTRLRWWAYGRDAPNAAITNAVRSDTVAGQRVLVEVTNFSASPGRTALSINDGRAQVLQLAARETARLVFDAPDRGSDVVIALSDDALAFDNRATLLPPVDKPVAVSVRVGDVGTEALVRRAVEATGLAIPVRGGEPDLIIADTDLSPRDARTWVMTIESPREAAAYAGPFVIDRGHPLTEGLSLEGVVWAAAPREEPPAASVIAAGNVPLLTDTQRIGGAHTLVMRWQPSLSTLQQTPDFPAIWWNLLHWRSRELPGVEQSNLRLGQSVTLVVDDVRSEVTVIDPEGEATKMPAADRIVSIPPATAGVHELRVSAPERPTATYRVAVNPLAFAESDLRGAVEGRFGSWIDDEARHREYRSVVWTLGLAALALLCIHGWLMSRRSV